MTGCITEAQRRRFFAIAQQQGWTMAALKDFLQGYGYISPSQIPHTEYDRIISALHAPEGPADGDAA